MNIVTLYPPIALATVITFFVMMILWKGHREEKRRGEPPIWMVLVILAYIGSLGAFFYFHADDGIETHFGMMMTALTGQAFGLLAVFAIWNAIWASREYPLQAKIFSYVVLVIFASLLLAGFFI